MADTPPNETPANETIFPKAAEESDDDDAWDAEDYVVPKVVVEPVIEVQDTGGGKGRKGKKGRKGGNQPQQQQYPSYSEVKPPGVADAGGYGDGGGPGNYATNSRAAGLQGGGFGGGGGSGLGLRSDPVFGGGGGGAPDAADAQWLAKRKAGGGTKPINLKQMATAGGSSAQALSSLSTPVEQKKPRCVQCTRPLTTDQERRQVTCSKCMH